MSVNMRTVAMITMDNLVSVRATFVDGGDEYTFVADRTLAETLSVDDRVAVKKTNGSLAIVKVTQVDDDMDVDVEASYNYTFVVCKIDMTYSDIMEAAITEHVKALNRRRREAIRKTVVANVLAQIDG